VQHRHHDLRRVHPERTSGRDARVGQAVAVGGRPANAATLRRLSAGTNPLRFLVSDGRGTRLSLAALVVARRRDRVRSARGWMTGPIGSRCSGDAMNGSRRPNLRPNALPGASTATSRPVLLSTRR
jgi:hypothetical protein